MSVRCLRHVIVLITSPISKHIVLMAGTNLLRVKHEVLVAGGILTTTDNDADDGYFPGN